LDHPGGGHLACPLTCFPGSRPAAPGALLMPPTEAGGVPTVDKGRCYNYTQNHCGTPPSPVG